MILTGKAKEDCLDWVYDNYSILINSEYNESVVELFDIIPTVSEYALIVEWFDRIGIKTSFEYHDHLCQFTAKVKSIYNNIRIDVELCDTRTEAIKAAIEKANTLYNEKP